MVLFSIIVVKVLFSLLVRLEKKSNFKTKFVGFTLSGCLWTTVTIIDNDLEPPEVESSTGSIIIGPLMAEASDGTPMRVLGRGITSGLTPEPPEPQSANSNHSSEPVSKAKCPKCLKRFSKCVLDLFCK